MEWQLAMLLIFGSLLLFFSMGMPVVIAFMVANIVWIFLLCGGTGGLETLILSIHRSVTNFTYIPVPLFIFMGEVMFQSGVGTRMIHALDMSLGRLPGRLGVLAVAAGTLLASLTGVSMASVAMLGSVLVPEMEKRGYKKSMSMGPILGSGGLAIMIPPSALAVILGALGEISIGQLLIGIILPGLLMAALYIAYIILRCRLQPDIAPPYEMTPTPLWHKLVAFVRDVLPLGLVIFLVIGLIFLGVATPSEAAAAGCLGTIVVALLYRKMSWSIMYKSLHTTVETSIMSLIIIAGADAFSRVLAFTEASRGLSEFVVGLPVSPIVIMILIQVVGLFLGCFMSSVAVMMITIPVFMPIVHALNFDPVWFAVMFLLNIETGQITPPYGMSLFVMEGVAPRGTTTSAIWRAAMPYIYMNILSAALIMAFPAIALWLPRVMSPTG